MSLTQKSEVCGLVLTLLFAVNLSQAQGPNPLPRHPGDVIKYEINFDGSNANTVKTVTASLNLNGSQPKDQTYGFVVNFGTPQPVSPSPTNTFVVEMTVPPNVSSGNYVLNVSARTDEHGNIGYGEGSGFDVPAIHIENSKTFTAPSISVKPLP